MNGGSPHPTPRVDEVVADLDTHGYGLLTGVADAERVARIRSELVAVAADERERGADASYHGSSNQRVYRLLAHGPTFVDVARDPAVLELVERTIGPDPILSNLSANIAGPGGRMQAVHADQGFLPEPWDEAWALQVVWMLDDFTDEGGATRVVPGSHRERGRPTRAVRLDDTVPVCAPAGTLGIFDARVWHGTGVNRTEAARPEDRRHALLAFYTRPFLRQQELWAVSLPPEVYRDDPELARLLGILPWQHLGLVAGVPADIAAHA